MTVLVVHENLITKIARLPHLVSGDEWLRSVRTFERAVSPL